MAFHHGHMEAPANLLQTILIIVGEHEMPISMLSTEISALI
jgi:hypothetical protein